MRKTLAILKILLLSFIFSCNVSKQAKRNIIIKDILSNGDTLVSDYKTKNIDSSIYIIKKKQ